jgi:hypothetical protein
VDRPPNTAHNLNIAGVLFKLQSLVVQRLQQFLGALEEELSQLGYALVGLAHDLTSTL